VKHLIRRVLHPIGLDIVRADGPNTIEGHLRRLLPALGVSCVLDVGAHHGEYARLLRHVGYCGRIVSFEPVRTNFAVLQQRCRRDPDWKGVPIALGPAPAVQRINVLAATELSSFLTPNAHAAVWFGRGSQVVRTEEVSVQRLDDVLETCTTGLAAPRLFLKLDTQGYDSAVLSGAPRTLAAVVGLQIELAVRPLYQEVLLFPDNLRPLLDLGFDLTGLFSVAREPDGIAQIEFDCVLRRRGD
jgi:FkbM family methyltransferase